MTANPVATSSRSAIVSAVPAPSVRTGAPQDTFVLGASDRADDSMRRLAQMAHGHTHPVESMGAVADARPGGRVSVHGMVVFGSPSTGIYMSHIPMFHRPHDVQAIFKVTLPGDLAFQDGLYTFQPEPFSLDDVLLGRLDTMQGTLFRGSFEGDGKPLTAIDVKVERLLPGAQALKHDAPAVPGLE